MPISQVLRSTLLSIREMIVAAGPLVFVGIAAVVIAYQMLDPTPPTRVVLATGPEQSAYAEFGKRYAELLKVHGITVELKHTQGAAENLALLRHADSGVDLAFVQGGSGDVKPGEDDTDAAQGSALVSLGSLFYEPVWLFYREDAARRRLPASNKTRTLDALSQLAGWKLNVGEAGSGVPNLMARIFEANGIDMANIQVSRQATTPAVVALLGGELDALVFASAPESAMVQMLLRTPGMRLFDFAQAEAYSRRFSFMSAVTLPRGVVDLAADVPAHDLHLVAPTATLVARRTMHPALIQLFVQTAQAVHGGPGWFQRKGDFPSPANTERPLAKEAERFYRGGPPFLQRYLPFWLANLIDRMWLVLISIVAVLIPLARVVPPIYEHRIRSRIFRWYGQLREIEDDQPRKPAEELLKRLDEIDRHVGLIHVPLSYADELYSLRGHIQLVRRRLSSSP